MNNLEAIAAKLNEFERRIGALEVIEIPGNFTPSGILFANSTGIPIQDPSFVWDAVNNRLGVGTNAPIGKLTVTADDGNGLQTTRPRQIFITGASNTNLRAEIGLDTTLKTLVIGNLEEGIAWHNIVLANNGGNVGIGSQAIVPSGLLHLRQAGGSKTFAFIEDTSASSDLLLLLKASGISSGSYFTRFQDGSGTDKFYVRGDGVGYHSGALTVDGDISTGGGLFANYGVASSQIRMYDVINLANNSAAQIEDTGGGPFGIIFVMNNTNGQVAIFSLRGGGHATQEMSDPGGVFSNTAGTATSTNVYWNAGTARYEIENKTGGTATYYTIFLRH